MKKLICDTMLIFAVLGMMAAVGALIEQTMAAPVALLLLAVCAWSAYGLNRLAKVAPKQSPKPVHRSAAPKLRIKPTRKAQKRLVAA